MSAPTVIGVSLKVIQPFNLKLSCRERVERSFF